MIYIYKADIHVYNFYIIMWSYVCTNRKGSNRRTEKTQLANLLDTRLLTSLQSLVVFNSWGSTRQYSLHASDKLWSVFPSDSEEFTVSVKSSK